MLRLPMCHSPMSKADTEIVLKTEDGKYSGISSGAHFQG